MPAKTEDLFPDQKKLFLLDGMALFFKRLFLRRILNGRKQLRC